MHTHILQLFTSTTSTPTSAPSATRNMIRLSWLNSLRALFLVAICYQHFLSPYSQAQITPFHTCTPNVDVLEQHCLMTPVTPVIVSTYMYHAQLLNIYHVPCTCPAMSLSFLLLPTVACLSQSSFLQLHDTAMFLTRSAKADQLLAANLQRHHRGRSHMHLFCILKPASALPGHRKMPVCSKPADTAYRHHCCCPPRHNCCLSSPNTWRPYCCHTKPHTLAGTVAARTQMLPVKAQKPAAMLAAMSRCKHKVMWPKPAAHPRAIWVNQESSWQMIFRITLFKEPWLRTSNLWCCTCTHRP